MAEAGGGWRALKRIPTGARAGASTADAPPTNISQVGFYCLLYADYCDEMTKSRSKENTARV